MSDSGKSLEMTNPTITSATGFKPGGVWRFVSAVYRVENSTPLQPGQIICKLRDDNGRQFNDYRPCFKTISDSGPYVYEIQAILRPEGTLEPIDPNSEDIGAKGAEDLTFSLEIAGGTIYPPPTDVRQPVPIIEVDPCADFQGPGSSSGC